MLIQPSQVKIHNIVQEYAETDFGTSPSFSDNDHVNDSLSKLTIRLTNILNNLGLSVVQDDEVISGLDVKLSYAVDVYGTDHIYINVAPGKCFIDRTTIMLPSGITGIVNNAKSLLGGLTSGKLCFFLLYNFSPNIVSTTYTENRYLLISHTSQKEDFPPSPGSTGFYRSVRPNTSDELGMPIKSDLNPTMKTESSDEKQQFHTTDSSAFQPLKFEVCVVDTSSNTLVDPSSTLVGALTEGTTKAILFSDFNYSITDSTITFTESQNPYDYTFNINDESVSVKNETRYRFITKVLNGENLNIKK